MKTWKEHAKTLVVGVLVAGVVAAGVNLADAATFFTATSTTGSAVATSNAINTNNREEVRTRYLSDIADTNYPESPNNGADSKNCRAGVANPTTANSVARALNYFRGLNGAEAVKMDMTSGLQDYAQQAALNMSANGRLSHSVQKNSKCYSLKAQTGAYISNLSDSAGQTPAEQILWYFIDPSNLGASTMTKVGSNDRLGHRIALMDPTLATTSYGNVDGYNAVVVSGNHLVSTPDFNNKQIANDKAYKPEIMTWPSAGYFPYQLLTTNRDDRDDVERWSISFRGESKFDRPDLSQARVRVTGPNGAEVPITVLSNDQNGKGPGTWNYYNTLLIKMAKITDLPVGTDGSRDYTVSVSGIKGATRSSYTYTVKLFDPMISATRMAPQIKVYAAPRVAQGGYSEPAKLAVQGSTGMKYQWQRSKDAGKTWEDVKDKFRIPDSHTFYGTANDLDYAPGARTEDKWGLLRSAPIANRAEAESLRFRLKVTNPVGTSISEPMKLEYYGFDEDKVIRQGDKLIAKVSLQGNSDSVARHSDVIWKDQNDQKVGTGDTLTLTPEMKGKQIRPTVQFWLTSFMSASLYELKLPAYSVG